MFCIPAKEVFKSIVEGNKKPSKSVSLFNTSIITGVFIGVVALSLTATGGVFELLTITVIVAKSDVAPLKLLTLYVAFALPVKPLVGV